jgi:CRISPR-associated protein Csm4
MDCLACILKPRGPFHLGEREGLREGSDTFIRSDTLFSALCHSLLLLYGTPVLESFLAAMTGDAPPLRLSSAFPRWQGECYFPVPLNRVPADPDLKKLRFVSGPEFERLLAGGSLTGKSLDHGIPCKGVTPWFVTDAPKVRLSRLTGSADQGGFYRVGLVYYARDAELFFLAEFGTEEWRPKLEAAIRLMCDEGIGGYRSAGKGSFEQPVYRPVKIAVPDRPDGWLTLSLYFPAESEAPPLAEGWYGLADRKGYMYSPLQRSLRRKEVTMFAEGSVFPGPPGKGLLVDVRPEGVEVHGVYRYGLAFGLPCRLGG